VTGLTERTDAPAVKRKVAWGITGGGDRLKETIEAMKEMKEQYVSVAKVEVYLSKAAEHVVAYYKLTDDLKQSFGRVTVETNANSPFLAGWLQMKKYEFLVIAPATSNTVAKISLGIADTLLSNAVSMALKSSVPVYIMPTDCKEGLIYTTLPNSRGLTLKVRKEDADNVKKLEGMKNLVVLEKPGDIRGAFMKFFKPAHPDPEQE
jgi:archaeoflavoprotein AfpA